MDDGVLSKLSTELASDDWDVLVAHFLGVDHVGHTFGPASQAMEDKLNQMDSALRYTYFVYILFAPQSRQQGCWLQYRTAMVRSCVFFLCLQVRTANVFVVAVT